LRANAAGKGHHETANPACIAGRHGRFVRKRTPTARTWCAPNRPISRGRSAQWTGTCWCREAQGRARAALRANAAGIGDSRSTAAPDGEGALTLAQAALPAVHQRRYGTARRRIAAGRRDSRICWNSCKIPGKRNTGRRGNESGRTSNRTLSTRTPSPGRRRERHEISAAAGPRPSVSGVLNQFTARVRGSTW
jgi:hypothetical protein